MRGSGVRGALRQLATISTGVVLVLCAASACSDNSATNASGSDAGSDAGQHFADTECGKCLAQKCTDQHDDCFGDPECATSSSCFDACPPSEGGNVDAACAASCAPSSSAATQLWNALESCRSAAAATCTACGGGVDSGSSNPLLQAPNCPASTSTGCSACIDEQCCEPMMKCHNEPGCYDLNTCLTPCTDWTCMSACYDKYSANVATYTWYLGCFLVRCPGDEANCTQPTPDCGGCLYGGACKVEAANCLIQPACFKLTMCQQACKDSACDQACQAANPDGLELFGALTTCWDAKCLDVC